MKKIILTIGLVLSLATPVCALEFAAPEAPESAQELMPDATESFGQGLLQIMKELLSKIQPDLMSAAKICLSLICVAMLLSLLQTMESQTKSVVLLAGTVAVGMLLLNPTNTLIHLGVDTVREMGEYGKLLFPVMTAAMAAQGGVTSSTALYAGTAFFNSLLGTLIARIIAPMVYVFLCMSVANSAINDELLKKIRDFIKWLMTWALKIVLYVFTGYISVTGVVSGTADAAAVKAAKLTISGAVPVVGGILSDASEAVLVSAGIMKSAAGVYGLLVILAICAGPFLQIGLQYLLLKVTAGICGIFGTKEITALVHDFSSAMGLLLAMTGTVCLMLLISTVCFMRSVG